MHLACLGSPVLLQLARSGGHKSSRRAKTDEIDGYGQALRDTLSLDELA